MPHRNICKFLNNFSLLFSLVNNFVELIKTMHADAAEAFEEDFLRRGEDVWFDDEDVGLEVDFSFEAISRKEKTVNLSDLFLRKKTFTQELLAINFDFKNVPLALCCPLTKKLINDPVIFSDDGLTYERSAIEGRLLKEKKLINSYSLVDNFNKRAEINAYVEQAKKTRREDKNEAPSRQLTRSRSMSL